MKVAIIGCGSIALRKHIPAFMHNPRAEIKYFCSAYPGAAAAAAQQFGCGTAVTDYRVVLEDPEIDAVSVCTANQKHSEITIAALRAGKHVLCEKPAARTYREVLAMQKAQHETGRLLCIGVVNRFNANVNRVKTLIGEGELGELYQVYISFRARRSIPGLGGTFTTKAVSGGGVLIDWGVHYLDLVMYCCGNPVVRSVSAAAFAKLGNPIPQYTYEKMWAGPPVLDGICDVEEGVTGMIRTEGPVITFNGAWAQNIAPDEKYIDFLGTKGGVRLQYGKEFTLFSAEGGRLTETTVPASEASMFQREIDDFIHAVEYGQTPVNHIDAHIATVQLMDAIYRSAEENREIVL